MRYFFTSFLISIIGLFALFWFTKSVEALYLGLILAVLEVSLSFDNAVVNAKILQTMPKIWQKRFLFWGILIAVFGMRLVFPALLVYITTPLSLNQVWLLALYSPEKYQAALAIGHPLISAFGGGFLLMVFLQFFFDAKREIYWLRWLESNRLVLFLADLRLSKLIIAILVAAILFALEHKQQIVRAYLLGVLVHLALTILTILVNEKSKNLPKVLSAGLVGFLYLEVLDSSFSFDGVIGAFAITSNIWIIMLGLGIGAFFVRSMTLYMVDKRALQRFVYLDHGAHYAIGFLAVVMLVQIFQHVPEILTGTVGLLVIILAFVFSLLRA